MEPVELKDVIQAMQTMHERFEMRSESRGDDEVIAAHLAAIAALKAAQRELIAHANTTTVLDAVERVQ